MNARPTLQPMGAHGWTRRAAFAAAQFSIYRKLKTEHRKLSGKRGV